MCTSAHVHLREGKEVGIRGIQKKGKGKGDRGYNEKGTMKGVEMCAKRWRGKKTKGMERGRVVNREGYGGKVR